MTMIVPLLLLALLIWFWLDSARAREIATGICQAGCEQRQVQFLDQTVALKRIGLRWTSQGLRFRRLFQFDYSEEGSGRRDGHVILVGVRLEEFSLGLPSADNIIPLHRKPPDQQ